MGSFARVPDDRVPEEKESDDAQSKLGEFLSGRLADVDIDSVEAVREVRENR